MDGSRFGVGGARNVELWKIPVNLGACFHTWTAIARRKVNWFETDKIPTKMAKKDLSDGDMGNEIWERRTSNGCSSQQKFTQD